MCVLIYVALLAGVLFGVVLVGFFCVGWVFFVCFGGFFLQCLLCFLVPPVVFIFCASFLGKIVCPRLKVNT